MEKGKWDIGKILAMVAQPKEKPEPLKDAEIKRVDVPYITKESKVEKRPIRIFLPNNTVKPMPLIYVAHYEMSEDAQELRSYLKKGWAVASILLEPGKNYNGQIADDSLVFNNAALYTLRNMAEIDENRIAVVGGSAGAYTALMLNALQLGICCSVANGPITNLYFLLNIYAKETSRLNKQTLDKMSDTERKDFMGKMAKLPVPFAIVFDTFTTVFQNFPDPGNIERWEAFSPAALTETFCNPILINHFTSDVLVPVDQISKRFTFDLPGDSLPKDFRHRLPDDIPGKLKYSLEERLPKSDTRTECIPALDGNENYAIPFDANKRFNINIFDEGPIEGYASHRIQPGTGRADDISYLDAMFLKTAAKTNILTTEKLRLLLERYQGKSVQLPAHENVDDNVYGSLVVYRKEVLDELRKWKNDNGASALEEVFKKLIVAEKNTDCKNNLKNTMNEIIKLL